MLISAKSVHAVEAMAHMAAADPGKPRTVREIAEAIGKSISHTEQTFAKLRDAGLIRAERGPGGGYYLNRPAHEISIADIVAVFGNPSPIVPTRRRVPGAAKDTSEWHRTESLWEALNSNTLAFLDSVSLADVAPEQRDTSTSNNGVPEAAPAPVSAAGR